MYVTTTHRHRRLPTMYVSITRARGGSPTVAGPHPNTPPAGPHHANATVAVPLFPPTTAEHGAALPVAVTSATARALAHTTPAPDDAAPAVLILVAPAQRLPIAIGPFTTAANARVWRGGHNTDLARAGIACRALALHTPPDAATGGDR